MLHRWSTRLSTAIRYDAFTESSSVWATVGNPGYSMGDPILAGIQQVGSNKYVQAYDPVFALSIADDSGKCVKSSEFTEDNIVVRFGQRVVATCQYYTTATCDDLAVLSRL